MNKQDSGTPSDSTLPSKRFSVLRDPVHGDVYLTHEEIAVLDTREMQRLRGVKQLGTAYVAYPGALHTRFDHSIGTLHMTQAMVEAIQRNFELNPRGSQGIPAETARVIRMASLVHDVTHIPFGHNIEDQTGLFHRHDSVYRYERALGANTEIGAVLDGQGLRDDVLKTLLAASGADTGAPPYWSQVMSDTLCSDILDYLARDAYFTGLRLSIDPRIANYFRVDKETSNLFVDLAKRDLLREDILSEVVRLLEARYYFSERVYYHHAKVAAGALLARAVELAVVNDLVVEADFYDLEDATLLAMLSSKAAAACEHGQADVGERIASLVDRFRRRRLPKRAAVFPRYANADVQARLVDEFFSAAASRNRAKAEQRVMDVVQATTGQHVEVMFYCPATKMQLKEAQTHVRWPGEPGVRPLSNFADRVPRLADLERSYRDLWKFYVFADTRDAAILQKVQDASLAEFPGATNVYAIERGG